MKTTKVNLEKAAFILKTIAHPTRLAVIGVLNKEGSLTVNDICKRVDCEQSLLSHHLTNMKLKGLLKAEKSGTSVYYSLKEKNLMGIIQCIQKCDCHY